MKKILVTGTAGFIGMHTATRLLDRGDTVVGIDNLNDYYAVQLKQDRLSQLTGRPGFQFEKLSLEDRECYSSGSPSWGALFAYKSACLRGCKSRRIYECAGMLPTSADRSSDLCLIEFCVWGKSEDSVFSG